MKAMIAMAHHLDISLMAEGVETVQQMEQLKQLGCDGVQGFLISKPVPAEAFATQFLQQEWLLPVSHR